MPAGIIVKCNTLRDCLEDINPFIPKGTVTMPVYFSVSGATLSICCTTGCVYSCDLTVVNNSGISSTMTILYKSIVDYIPSNGDVVIEFNPYGLVVTTPIATITLPIGYSTITPPEIRNIEFTPVNSQGYVKGLNDILAFGLDSMYKKEKPIAIYDTVAVQKFPNVAIQTRTPGLGLTASMTGDHVKMLTRFRPTEIYTDNVDTLVLRRHNAYLELPLSPLHTENNFLEYLSDLSEPITLDTEHYLDRLRNMAKLGNNLKCKIVFYETGLKCSVNSENIDISMNLGNPEGEVKTVRYLPMQLWLSMIKVIGNTKAQFLYGSRTICLRTQSVIIVAFAII